MIQKIIIKNTIFIKKIYKPKKMSRIKNSKLELNLDQLKILKRVFNLYADRNGVVNLKDILEGMREAELDIKHPLAYDLISQLNASEYKNGIKYEQFCEEINKKLEDRESEDSIERSFAYFVENSDRNKIDANDIKRIADEVGEEMSEDQAKRIINRVGKTGKDADFDEFYMVMTKQAKI